MMAINIKSPQIPRLLFPSSLFWSYCWTIPGHPQQKVTSWDGISPAMAFPHESIERLPRAPSPVHKFGTLAVHAGSPHDPVTGAVIESVRHLQLFALYPNYSWHMTRYHCLRLLPRPALASPWAYTSILEARTQTGQTYLTFKGSIKLILSLEITLRRLLQLSNMPASP